MNPNKLKVIALLTILIGVSLLHAQGPDTMWTRAYGGTHDDCCYSVIEASTGGYVLAGWTHSFGAGQKDVYLLRTDPNGDTVWTRTFGGSANDEGRDIKETYDGGFIIAGWTESFGSGGSDVYLVKTDANGNLMWSKSYGSAEGGDRIYDVKITDDGGFVMAGCWGRGVPHNEAYLSTHRKSLLYRSNRATRRRQEHYN